MDILINTPRKGIPLISALLLGMAYLLSGQAFAANQTTGYQRPEVASVVASPSVCTLEKGAVLCHAKGAIIWEVPADGYYCLWDNTLPEPLQCWQDTWSGSIQYSFSDGQSRRFLLIHGNSGEVVAETTIKVIGALEQRVRARRRNRFWRMF